ncbi:hypothetical protein [Magnetospirillum molischianum]|uniref:hypothetical protein n=1 Tax=Magnetospirillum molischianum TaxID=1083 RepID=UPI0002FC2C43|nr:hypothetical protein [Magnetospirillum molischianum]
MNTDQGGGPTGRARSVPDAMIDQYNGDTTWNQYIDRDVKSEKNLIIFVGWEESD